MKLSLLLLASFFAVSGSVSASDNKGIPLTEQVELNCKIYGFAAAMLADRRDKGLEKEAAIADLKSNFANFDISAEKNRISVEYTLDSVDLIANEVYGLEKHKPDTLLHTFRVLCLSQSTGLADRSRFAEFFGQALVCQDRDPSALNQALDDCIVNNAKSLFPKK